MKTAIVTGASGNLGQAVVKKFLQENFRVIGTVIPDDPSVVDFSSDKFIKSVADLTNEKETEDLIAAIIDRYHTIDAAVLTVGGFAMGNIAETKTSDVARQYKLNFETTYNIARHVFTQMMKQKNGRIFMIGSKPGLNTVHGKGMIAYTLTKSLVFRLAELMNQEAKGLNVVTCVIVPTTIDTPQNRVSMPDADFSKWTKPETIAEIIFDSCLKEFDATGETVIRV